MDAVIGNALNNTQKFFAAVASAFVAENVYADTRARRLWLRKLKKRNLALMLLTLACVVTGLTMQLNKLAQIAAYKQNIQLAVQDNRVLAARTDNLLSEFRLETRSEVICQLAADKLGMVFPAASIALEIAPADQRPQYATIP